jgi:hypothetical protein
VGAPRVDLGSPGWASGRCELPGRQNSFRGRRYLSVPCSGRSPQ